jgi:hypothetical protein
MSVFNFFNWKHFIHIFSQINNLFLNVIPKRFFREIEKKQALPDELDEIYTENWVKIEKLVYLIWFDWILGINLAA